MRLYDNTRISAFRTCPRKYYFRHIRHWSSLYKAPALTFGSSWHSALDQLWSLHLSGAPDEEVFKSAIGAFIDKWKEDGFAFPLEMDEQERLNPRTPGVAAEMLVNYLNERREFFRTIELLEVERPFLVPLDTQSEKFGYVGKRDKTFRWQGHVWVGEHKTTSAYDTRQGIRQPYLDSYSPNAQVDGYTYAMHMEHGKDARGVLVDIALVHKTRHDVFKSLPIYRLPDVIDSWLTDTRHWIYSIELERTRLQEYRHRVETQGAHEQTLPCFRRNTDSCFTFFQACTYRDVCRLHGNPEVVPMPENCEEEKWSPIERLKLEQIGITDED